MKNNKKGGTSLKRPMHIRLLAFLMAVVMVISVMIIHNRNGKVEAADPITDETYLGQDGWLEEAHYTVYVPRKDITFKLPELPEPSMDNGVEATVYVKKDGEGNITEWLLEDDESGDCEAYIVKKYTSTSFAWSNNETTITSSTDSTSITATKTVTLMYMDDQTDITAELSVNQPDPDEEAIQIDVVTYAPQDITVDASANISDPDVKSDTDTVFYYGDFFYSVNGGAVQDEASAEATIAALPDEEYSVKKYIYVEGKNTVLYERSAPQTFNNKNTQLIMDYSIEEGNSSNTGVDSIEGVDPTHDVVIKITTDSNIDTDNSTTSIGTLNSASTSHMVTIPGDVAQNNGATKNVTVHLEDGAEMKQEITVSVKYIDGTPGLTGLTVDGAAENAGTYYVNANSSKITVSASGNSENVPIASAKILYASELDITKAAEISADSVDNGKISSNITNILKEGHNYIWIVATSTYGVDSDPSEQTPVHIYKDITKPTISNPVLKQEDVTIADNGKITCKKEAILEVNISDLPSSDGISLVASDGKNTLTTEKISDGLYKAIIPVEDENNARTVTYTLQSVDAVGNESDPITKTVHFYNDTISIDRKYVPDYEDEFIKWKDGTVDKTVAYIQYFVTSEAPIDKCEITVNGVEDAIHLTDKGIVDGKHCFEYALTYETSKTFAQIIFKATNTNGAYGIDKIEAVHVDVLDPDFEQKSFASGWVRGFIFKGKVKDKIGDDAGAVSNPGKVVYSITNSVDNTSDVIDLSEDGEFLIPIPESDGQGGTKLSLAIKDKANNTINKEFTFYVDDTRPLTSLTVEGLDSNELSGNGFYLKKDPKITYNGSDALSGLADKDAMVLNINGKDYKNVSEKTLSQIVGPLSDTTEYTVKLTVTDKAGNKADETRKFKVDLSGPDITVTKSSKGKYTNDKVDVTVSITDPNLDKKSVSLKRTYNKKNSGKNIELQWTRTGNTWSGTFTVDNKDNGKYTVVANASDLGGNSSKNDSTSFVIDTKAPEITLQVSKDGKNWKDYVVSDPSLEYIRFYPHVRAKVVDDNEKEDTETVEVACEPFDGSNSTSQTVIGKSYDFKKPCAQGLYTITFFVEDKAGNVAKNVTEGAESTEQMSIGFGLDFTAPKHNMYITSANPVNFERFNNTYKNLTGKFNKKYENYKYGQYYSGEVTIDLSAYDNSTDYDGEVTIMHKYRAPGESVATLYEDNEHVTFEGEADWEEDSDQHRKYKTITVDEAGDHEIWLKSSDHDDPNDGIGGCNTKEDTAHLFFTIDDTAPEVGLYLNGSPYNSGASNLYSSSVSTYASVTDNNIDYIVRNYTINPPGGSAITSSIDNYENASSELFETEADYTIDYTAYDRAGASNGPLSMAFRVDRTAPELTITGPGETTTNKSTVTFNLKEAFYSDMPAAKVTIYRRVDGIGEKVYESFDFNPNSANDSQSRTFNEDGEYRMEFTAEDKTGNSSKANYTFFQDADAPVITLGGVKNYDMTDTDVDLGVTVNETFYSTNNVKLTGTRTDIDGEKEILNFDNFPSNSSISTLRQVFTLDGIYDIKVTSKDKVGNESSQDIHFTIDKTNPLINELPIKDGEVLNKFTWDVDVDKLIKDLTVCEINIYIDGVLYDGVSEVADGVHVLKIEATDEMGNKSSEEINFTIDSIAPNIMISGVEDGQKVESAPTVNVSVQLDDDILSTVKLDGKDITVDGNEATFTVDKKGSHKIEATATDKAGNEASTSIEFVYGSSVNLMPVFIIAGILILLLIIGFIVYRMRKNQA